MGHDDGRELAVGRLQTNSPVFLLEIRLHRRLAVGKQRDDTLAVTSSSARFDEDIIAVQDSLVTHGHAIDFERKRLRLATTAWREQIIKRERVALRELLDRIARGNSSEQGE